MSGKLVGIYPEIKVVIRYRSSCYLAYTVIIIMFFGVLFVCPLILFSDTGSLIHLRDFGEIAAKLKRFSKSKVVWTPLMVTL